MSPAADWLERLQALAVRFSGWGIGPDLAGLTLGEPSGLFLFLRRMAEGGRDAG